MGILAKIISQSSRLNFEDLFLLSEQISLQRSKHKEEIYTRLGEQVKSCPHCQSGNYITWGNYNKMKRFMCKECNRTFIPTTGTAMHWLKKPNEFINYLTVVSGVGGYVFDRLSNRVGISSDSAFYWRHRILIALNSGTPMFKKATEMDDIWVRYSQKGCTGS